MRKQKVQNRSTKDDLVTQEIPLACASEVAAVEFMERKRWGDCPTCPDCKSTKVYKMVGKDGKRQANFRWRCKECSKQYTVRVDTIFAESRIKLRHWCYVFWRASTSKKGVSALEIHRHTGVSYKSSLFMMQRIRHAMSDSVTEPLSGQVEVDELYVGGKPRYKGKDKNGKWINKRGRGTNKQPVMAMLQRGGKVKTRVIADITGDTFKDAIREMVAWNSAIITDEHKSYIGIGKYYLGGHHTT